MIIMMARNPPLTAPRSKTTKGTTKSFSLDLRLAEKGTTAKCGPRVPSGRHMSQFLCFLSFFHATQITVNSWSNHGLTIAGQLLCKAKKLLIKFARFVGVGVAPLELPPVPVPMA